RLRCGSSCAICGCLESALKLLPLLGGQLDQRRADGAPGVIAGPRRDRLLETGDERDAVVRRADRVELTLPLFAALPERAGDGGSVHVGGGGDAPCAALRQVCQQELLGADEGLEAGERAKNGAGVRE